MGEKIFLYAEIQVSIPFEQIPWKEIDVAMKKNPGIKSKTWLSGINTNTIGGFYEFDLLENAKATPRAISPRRRSSSAAH